MRLPLLDNRDDLLGQAANEYFEAAARGESPSLAEFADRYPEIADDIRRVFPALALVGDTKATKTPSITFWGVSDRQQVGDYLILREVGRGGMGIVYEAEQLSLSRRVALKVLPFTAILDEKAIVRFKNEARAAATLDHPNIVPIHGVGNERGVYYYAMSLIEGRTLAEVIRSLKARLPSFAGAGHSEEQAVGPLNLMNGAADSMTRETRDKAACIGTKCDHEDFVSTWPHFDSREYCSVVARLGVQAARALEHAHERGIVHRDIKPANLMINAAGKLWITDFGLARINSDAGLTMSGDLLGTIRYMAPEQILGQNVAVDHRADVYSLGVTLYELLALRPAIEGDERQLILKQISVEEPQPLRKLHMSLPVDFETIVGKATAKQPSERYQSAKDFADDLERLLDRKPIVARPPTLLDKAAKWMQRHSALVIMAGVSLFVLSIVLAVGMALLKERELTATAATNETSRLLYEAEMALAFQAYEQGWSEEAARILARVHQTKGSPQQHGTEWDLLHAAIRPPASVSLLGHQGSVNEIAVFPDGKRLASVGNDGTLRIWDLQSQRQLRNVDLSDEPLYSVAVSPDGRRVAAGSHVVFVYGLEEVREPKAIFQSEHNIESMAFLADGTQLTVGSRYHDVFLLTLEGELVGRVANDARKLSLEFAPNANQLLVPSRKTSAGGEREGSLQIWAGDLSEVQKEFIDPDNRINITVARYLPGSQTIAAGERQSRRAHLVHSELTKIIASTSAPQSRSRAVLTDLGVSPSGTAIATAYDDGTIDFHPLQSDQGSISFGKRLRTFRAHEGEASSVRFVSDHEFATCGTDGAIRIWTCPANRAYDFGESRVVDVRLSPDGNLLLYTSEGGYSIVDAADGRIRHKSMDSVPLNSGAAWSPTGDRFAVCLTPRSGARVRVLDQRGEKICAIMHAGEPKTMAFSPANQLISVIGDTQIQICNSESGEVITQQTLTSPGLEVAFSNNGKSLAYCDGRGRIYICAVPRLKSPLVLTYSGMDAQCLGFSPDDTTLASGHDDGMVRLWDLVTGSVRVEFLGHDGTVRDVAFSPDGRTLLTCDGVVRLWSVDHGRSYGAFHEMAYRMSLSADGRRLAVGSRPASSNGSDVLLWNLNESD